MNENVKKESIYTIENISEVDEEWYMAELNISKNGKVYGSLILNLTEEQLLNYLDDKTSFLTDDRLKEAFSKYTHEHLDQIEALPLISEASPLLKDIYNQVCESDAHMSFITEDDFYEDYNDTDLETLKDEIKKYHLEDVISFNLDDMITGFADLSSKFIDNTCVLNKESTKDDFEM